jgi:hypothetical protein
MSRRFQFSLRALLVAMLVVAAFFGGSQFGAKRERERLTSELKSAHDKIARDTETLIRAHKILRALKGDDSDEVRVEAAILSQLQRQLREKKP